MVTIDVTKVYHNKEQYTLEDVQVTIDEETKLTDAKGKCLFKNIKPGVHEMTIFKDGFGCMRGYCKVESTPDVQDWGFGLLENVYLKLSADKTKIKKNETVTIVAQLFKHDKIVTDLKQVSFSINETQKVISDFDIDKEVAVMTLKGSNQGKVKIIANAFFKNNLANTEWANSNVLFLHDGVEE